MKMSGVIYSIMNGNFLVSFRQWRLPPNLKDLELVTNYILYLFI